MSAPSSAGLCPTLAFRLQQTHEENVPSQGTSAPVAFEPWASSGLSDQRTERRRDRVDAVSAEGPVLPPGFLGESRGRSPALAHVGQRPPSNQSTRKCIPGRFCFLFFVSFVCLFQADLGEMFWNIFASDPRRNFFFFSFERCPLHPSSVVIRYNLDGMKAEVTLNTLALLRARKKAPLCLGNYSVSGEGLFLKGQAALFPRR